MLTINLGLIDFLQFGKILLIGAALAIIPFLFVFKIQKVQALIRTFVRSV